MNDTIPKKTCALCPALRGLSLHLYELALYCDYLDNLRTTYVRKKGILIPDQEAQTATAAGWLRLASQVQRVDLDTYRFQAAQLYCEPVDELLRSDAEHHSAITTPLTKFIFFCNALEEIFRFVSPTYETAFDNSARHGGKQEYLRSHSMQAALLLDHSGHTDIPYDYGHLVENLSKITKIYLDQTGGTMDTAGKTVQDLCFGIQLIRNVRNQVAHGVFPLLENPEYSTRSNHFQVRNTINLLNQCTRVGAISIQMILNIDNDGFQAQVYGDASNDPETGNYFATQMHGGYLMTLHRSQEFGLNEEAYFKWSEYSDSQ